jgi:dihydroorotase
MPGRRRPERDDASERPSLAPERVLAGRSLVHGRIQAVEVGLDSDGRILRVAKQMRGASRRDFGEMILMPSATDLHVHLREPASADSIENFASGTEQAAVGGVSAVGEMPNGSPPADRVDRLEAKRDRARGRLAVDAFLYGLASHPERISSLASIAAAFKLFECPTTGIDEPPDAPTRVQLLQEVDRVGLPLVVHAEDPAFFRATPAAETLSDWNRARPPEAEERAVTELLQAAPPLRLHFAHLTTVASIRRVRQAGFSCEVSPHHLLLAAGPAADARRKVNPPLRAEEMRSELYEAFRHGEIPMLASDHAPHSASVKAPPFDRAASGVPGLSTMLPLLLAEVRAGRLDLGTLIATACDRPARWMGLPQGRLVPRHAGRILAVDFRQRTEISARRLPAPCGWTPFEGREAIFPAYHIFDGNEIASAGQYTGSRVGRVVRPEFARPPAPHARPSG